MDASRADDGEVDGQGQGNLQGRWDSLQSGPRIGSGHKIDVAPADPQLSCSDAPPC